MIKLTKNQQAECKLALNSGSCGYKSAINNHTCMKTRMADATEIQRGAKLGIVLYPIFY